jgi:hypothetical protein
MPVLDSTTEHLGQQILMPNHAVVATTDALQPLHHRWRWWVLQCMTTDLASPSLPVIHDMMLEMGPCISLPRAIAFHF